jgi:cytochrome c oxidase accessory protein FixG
MSTTHTETESYRDKISTVDAQGKRVWIYPKKPKGPFTHAREILAIFLLAFFFSAPFIKIDGHSFLLFDILNRKFIIFGLVFWPQDFHLFVLATLSLVVFVVLFTVVLGRLWCGWACPQTVFMEMVFRKIEYWIEGDARKQIALSKQPWTAQKVFKKTLKHSLFFAISFLIGNTFLAYIIGSEKLLKIISDPPSQHIAGLMAMVIFSTIFYGVFAFFREQVCTLVCPYGRLQGVLLDQNSIVVAYDFKRGEQRGKLSKNQERKSFGDCVDCHQCVEVCPTGIDIRNGTQLECINCTACIDACNTVMKKLKWPTGLIRYDSYNGISMGKKLGLSPRIFGYSIILLVLLIVTATFLFMRSPVETTILRTPGLLFQETPEGNISNLYNLKVINKTYREKPIRLKLRSPQGRIKMVGGELIVPDGGLTETAFFVEIPIKNLIFVNTPIEIEIYSGQKLLDHIRTSFLGPNQQQKENN